MSAGLAKLSPKGNDGMQAKGVLRVKGYVQFVRTNVFGELCARVQNCSAARKRVSGLSGVRGSGGVCIPCTQNLWANQVQ